MIRTHPCFHLGIFTLLKNFVGGCYVNKSTQGFRKNCLPCFYCLPHVFILDFFFLAKDFIFKIQTRRKVEFLFWNNFWHNFQRDMNLANEWYNTVNWRLKMNSTSHELFLGKLISKLKQWERARERETKRKRQTDRQTDTKREHYFHCLFWSIEW